MSRDVQAPRPHPRSGDILARWATERSLLNYGVAVIPPLAAPTSRLGVVGTCRRGSESKRPFWPPPDLPGNEFREQREGTLQKRPFREARCRRSRLFSFVTETTEARGSTPVGASKKRCEAQESNTRKSSPDTAVRFRSYVEAPAINYSGRPGPGSCRRSNSPAAPSSVTRGGILDWVREQQERGGRVCTSSRVSV